MWRRGDWGTTEHHRTFGFAITLGIWLEEIATLFATCITTSRSASWWPDSGDTRIYRACLSPVPSEDGLCLPPPPNSTQGHLTGRASATSRVLITWESEIGLLFFSLVRWGRWKEVSMVVECKQHITLGLDTQMHGLPPSSGSSVLLGHFHHDYTLLTVLSKVLH